MGATTTSAPAQVPQASQTPAAPGLSWELGIAVAVGYFVLNLLGKWGGNLIEGGFGRLVRQEEKDKEALKDAIKNINSGFEEHKKANELRSSEQAIFYRAELEKHRAEIRREQTEAMSTAVRMAKDEFERDQREHEAPPPSAPRRRR